MLLDEPLSNLDTKLRERMRSELKRLQRELGITTLYVTHDQIESIHMSDRVAVMSGGRILQMASQTKSTSAPQPVCRRFHGLDQLDQWHTAQICPRSRRGKLVDTDLGPLQCSFAAPFAAGTKVTISQCGPENIKSPRKRLP